MIAKQRLELRLRQLRLSLTAIAREIDLTIPDIKELVSGRLYLPGKLRALARRLEISPDWLTGKSDDPSIEIADLVLTEQDWEIVKAVQGLTPQDRTTLLAIAHRMATAAASPAVHERGYDPWG